MAQPNLIGGEFTAPTNSILAMELEVCEIVYFIPSSHEKFYRRGPFRVLPPQRVDTISMDESPSPAGVPSDALP